MSMSELESLPLHLRRFFNRVQELPFELRVAAWRGAGVAFDEAGAPLQPSVPCTVNRLRMAARLLDELGIEFGEARPTVSLKVHGCDEKEFYAIAERFSLSPAKAKGVEWVTATLTEGVELVVFRD